VSRILCLVFFVESLMLASFVFHLDSGEFTDAAARVEARDCKLDQEEADLHIITTLRAIVYTSSSVHHCGIAVCS